ncbi:hypothetical protein FE236_10795 [Mariprofundus erugo]|uniref:TIGR04219 family outer membrane beta-barrel protein n=1 Tax=Mariprofundus erugo TaxID=2528639 RepID=A0A5R9GVG1_9PROT|nr:hypothetical protein [Mariprofundus erugo]TLS67972.1 hypothetical protein FEF65_05885 [Mariprofundus erugo]TLS74891.1 hypothetical protein FE236_10795 [Mariprofundus erugo]
MKYKAIALLAAAIGISHTALADEAFSIKPGYMLLSPSGTFGTTINNAGNQMDVKKDLNFGNSSQAFGEIDINLGDSTLAVSYVPFNFGGSSTLTRNVTYNGQTYTAATATSSSVQGNIFDVGYTYYLLNMDDLPSRIQIGIETAAKTISAQASVTGAGVTSSKSITLPIPTLGLRGRVALADFIGVTGRIGYIGYANNAFTDMESQIEFSPLPTLGIFAGYRYMKLKIDNSGFLANMTMKGPIVGGFFRF